MRVIRGCLAQIGCLTVLLILAVGAWLFRDEIRERAGRWWDRIEAVGDGAEPSEDLARSAERKLRELATGDAPSTVRLEEPEVQSLIAYRIAPGLPEGVEDPVVDLRDSVVVFTAALRLDSLENRAMADMLRAFVSDSARVTAELTPEVIAPGEGRWTVRTLQAGSVVIPSMAVPWVLGALDLPGVRASGSSLYVPIPPHLAAIRVEPGALVLHTGEVPAETDAATSGPRGSSRAHRRGSGREDRPESWALVHD